MKLPDCFVPLFSEVICRLCNVSDRASVNDVFPLACAGEDRQCEVVDAMTSILK